MRRTVSFDPYITAVQLGDLIRRREVSVTEVVQHYLERTDRLDVELNSIVWRRDELLREEAAQADRVLAAREVVPPPFFGVPLAIKELTQIEGQPNHRASLGLPDEPAEETEGFAKQLFGAGFLQHGRSASPEIGRAPVTESLRHGVTRNPWNLGYTSGGSSGGSASAVAAGLVPIATASDSAGSTRMPASATGLVGLVPSRGLIPRANWTAVSVTDGVLTRDVRDTAAFLDVVAVPAPTDWVDVAKPPRSYLSDLLQPTPRHRVGVLLDRPDGGRTDIAVRRAVESVAETLEKLGHEIVPVDPKLIPAAELWEARAVVQGPGFAPEVFDLEANVLPSIRETAAQRSHVSVSDYHAVLARVQATVQRFKAAWYRDFDVLLTPTLAIEVPEAGLLVKAAGELSDAPAEKWAEIGSGLLAHVGWVNLTGLPAVSLPTHVSESGLPIGVQLVGRPNADSSLLQLGHDLEQIYLWHTRTPRFGGE